jgi:AraC-like DNA-binding protein
MWVSQGSEPAGSPLQVHVHRGMDVGVLLRGKYELQYGDYWFVPERGDVWLGAMWEPHSWRVLEPNSVSVQVCFLPEVLDEPGDTNLDLLRVFAVPASQRPRVTSEQMRAKVVALAERMRAEVEPKEPGWRIVVRACLLELLVLLTRHWTPPEPARSGGAATANDLARVIPALALAHRTPGARVTPREAAEASGLSLSGFHHIFRRAMGLSYGQFCLRSRLAEAAQTLLGTGMPVQAVAEQTGFADASHLHRAFVAEYGCTPAEYRRRAQAPTPEA